MFFAYFYTAIQFDPVRTADNLRKNGGFIPGIRPGPPTADYLNAILVRITLPGSLFLAAIALIPTIVLACWKIDQFPFGGTSILIAVGVALETMKQIESQLMMRHYEGFLKEGAPRCGSSSWASGGGEGDAGPAPGRAARYPAALHGRHPARAVQEGTPLGIEARIFMDRGEYVPDGVMVRMVGERLHEPDARRGSSSTGSRARCRRPGRSTSCSARRARPWTRWCSS